MINAKEATLIHQSQEQKERIRNQKAQKLRLLITAQVEALLEK